MKISRRDLLKAGAAGATLVVAGEALGGIAAAERIGPGGRNVSRTTGLPRQSVASTCQLCPARCGILGFTEEGRLVKIEGNPKHPNNQGRLCAKGLAGVDLVYDQERVLYPLRRAGARGQGQWERISWDEALNAIATRLGALQGAGRAEEFYFLAGTGATQSIISRFLDSYGTPHSFNRRPHGDENKAVALNLTWGAPLEVPDLAHSKYVLNFGANPYEAHLLHLPLAQRLIEGRVGNGAKLVTFDVRLSHTASRSDEWFPIRPGTDGLVALAMAQVIVEEGLFDAPFLERWTTYPVDTLRAYLSRFTPEMAEEQAGLPAATLRRIAMEFAHSRPATTISGTGVSMHYNGVQNERAVALLNAITGNVEVRGGYCLPRTYSLTEPEPVPPPVPGFSELARSRNFPFLPHAPVHGVLASINDSAVRVGVLMIYMHNPAYSNPDTALAEAVLRDENRIPFFVAVDTYLSESAALADIVLPDTTYLERWDLESGPALDMVPYLALRQPVVKPQGEARSFQEVCAELARRLGGGMDNYFRFGSYQAYLREMALRVPGLAQAGGWEMLRRDGVWYDAEAKPAYRSYLANGFNTPSGRFETYSSRLLARGYAPLPTFDPIPAHQVMESEELYLVTFKWSVLNSFNATSKLVSEITHDNPVWMNTDTATERGIKKGDQVTVTSAVGTVVGRVHTTQGIHPQVVAISGGAGHWEMGRVARGRRFESDDPQTRFIWWDKHGSGISPNRVVPVVMSPIGGGQAWHDTVVKVTKV